MNVRVPGWANVTVVRALPERVDRDLRRTSVVGRLGAGPVALVKRLVADDPLVVDRVGVVDDERHRPAGRDADRGRLELRVVDRDVDDDRLIGSAGRAGDDRRPDRRRKPESEGCDGAIEGHVLRPGSAERVGWAGSGSSGGSPRRPSARRGPRSAGVRYRCPGPIARRAGHLEAGVDPGRSPGAARVDREVVGEAASPRNRSRPWSARPSSGPTPCRGPTAGRRAGCWLASELWSRRMPLLPVGLGRSTGGASVRRKTSASIRSLPVLPRARIRSGTHGLSVGIVMWTEVPSPTCWPRSAAASASKAAARKIWLRWA